MDFKAKLSSLRVAPRKVRIVADMIRWKRVEEAQSILRFTVKKASLPLLKLLNSAVANAKNQTDSSNLYISKITVDEGPKYKRWMPRARGSASEIQKKTSHINLVLSEVKEGAKIKKAEKKQVVEKEIPEVTEEKKVPGFVKPRTRPSFEKPKPKIVRGINRIFRRKAV